MLCSDLLHCSLAGAVDVVFYCIFLAGSCDCCVMILLHCSLWLLYSMIDKFVFSCIHLLQELSLLCSQRSLLFTDSLALWSKSYDCYVMTRISSIVTKTRRTSSYSYMTKHYISWWMRSSRVWMRSSRGVRASDFQCLCRNSPDFDPSILRHSGICWAADEAVLNNVQKIQKILLYKNIITFSHLCTVLYRRKPFALYDFALEGFYFLGPWIVLAELWFFDIVWIQRGGKVYNPLISINL